MKFVKFAAAAIIATAATGPAAFAQDKPAAEGIDNKSCSRPEYPSRALRNQQDGIVEAAFLIGPDGAVQDRFVPTSSGVPELDRATLEGLGKCRFKPVMVDGKPVTRWQTVVYKWELDPPSEASPQFLRAAESGPAAAQYLLALMYSKGFMVGKDEPASRRWLQVAAERGFAMAQYKLGLAYENGEGVAQDDVQAALWYRKAAAQRNTFAREKLHFGFGSIAAAPEPAS